MSFENTAGIGVSNHYGPRDSGGTFGVNGELDSFSINLDGENLGFDFPISNHTTMPGVKTVITGIYDDLATGAITTLTIGGVDVSAATSKAPVVLAEDNTGAVVIAGPTAGTVLIKFMKYKG